uniref:Uncharacterized protein n=1 Tax=Anguilla anguilla TaxID=7936 RepID=A0A0E9UAN7_ANGAN
MRFSSEVQMPSVIMWFGSVVHSPSPRAATVKPDSASFTGKKYTAFYKRRHPKVFINFLFIIKTGNEPTPEPQ